MQKRLLDVAKVLQLTVSTTAAAVAVNVSAPSRPVALSAALQALLTHITHLAALETAATTATTTTTAQSRLAAVTDCGRIPIDGSSCYAAVVAVLHADLALPDPLVNNDNNKQDNQVNYQDNHQDYAPPVDGGRVSALLRQWLLWRQHTHPAQVATLLQAVRTSTSTSTSATNSTSDSTSANHRVIEYLATLEAALASATPPSASESSTHKTFPWKRRQQTRFGFTAIGYGDMSTKETDFELSPSPSDV